jgi:hypothetical protein
MSTNSFLDRVVSATKLSPLLAPFVVRRICVNQGVIAAELGPAELQRILPKLLEAVGQYLEPAVLAAARADLERLARSSSDAGAAAR